MIDALVLRLVNRRQIAPADFIRRGNQSLEEVLAEAPNTPTIAKPSPPEILAPWEDEPLRAPENQSDSPGRVEAAPAKKLVPVADAGEESAEAYGVYLHDMGRKIFLKELFRRLRERVYYPPRDANLELRDILRQQCYHLARVIEGKEPRYQPFEMH